MVKHNVQALSSSILKVFVQYNSIHMSFPKTFEYREFWNSFSFFFTLLRKWFIYYVILVILLQTIFMANLKKLKIIEI